MKAKEVKRRNRNEVTEVTHNGLFFAFTFNMRGPRNADALFRFRLQILPRRKSKTKPGSFRDTLIVFEAFCCTYIYEHVKKRTLTHQKN